MKPFAITLALCATTAFIEAAPKPAWVTESDKISTRLLQRQAEFSPESGSAVGLEGYDDRIIDLKANLYERQRDSLESTLKMLRQELANQNDPLVKQDIQILIDDTQDTLEGLHLSRKYRIPYFSATQIVFNGLRTLLDDQIAPERRKAAVVRLKKYTGIEPGSTPLVELAQARIRERLNTPNLLGPPKLQVDKDLENTAFFLQGIEQAFTKYKLDGWQEAFASLKQQTAVYDNFVRKEILPKARTDFRLPPELYAYNLRSVGVDIPATELVTMAHAAFDDLQQRMQKLAPEVARQHGFKVTDYRDVIRELKKDQLAGDQILPHYRARIEEIEKIVTREKLVSLPNRPPRMRLATPAESAQQPAPHMRPPRMVNNNGETGEFVLPLVTPSSKGEDKKMDDFTYAAASFSLAAHEARPGHEMQFSAMIERGVSLARANFAFNSTNVEGWGLYAERIMLPFMPPDAQLISLNMRLMRAARAFLDPELHMGKVTREQAYDLLRKDIVLSDAMATQEVDRYTFRSPAQATSYFYGYTKLEELRRDVEKALGAKFNQKDFHDFILAQGLLPPKLLRQALMTDFVAARKGS